MRLLSTTVEATKIMWWNRMSMCSYAKQVILEDVMFYNPVETLVSRASVADREEHIDFIVHDIDFHYGYSLGVSILSRVSVRISPMYAQGAYLEPVFLRLTGELMERFTRRLASKYENRKELL